MTLTGFLLARIAEDEADAKLAVGGGSGVWTQDGGSIYDGHVTNEIVDWVYDDGWAHIARHDPVRVLAECEARRRILAMESIVVARLLALPYADHPDYDEAWRP